jgi:hypothetical protein
MYFTTMPRLAVRRVSELGPYEPATGILPLLLGLSLGVAAGFVLGELVGPVATRTLRNGRIDFPLTRGRQLVIELVEQAQAALEGDLLVRDCHLRVVGIGDGRIELHGWVGDRRSRAHAAQLVRRAVVADEIINCVLVRGEDDVNADGDADETLSDERMA